MTPKQSHEPTRVGGRLETMKKFEFKCSCCDEIHEGIPTFGAKYPMNVLYVPEEERGDRVDLNDNECVIDGASFYLRGCIEIAVNGYDENFIWGAWVQVREEDFSEYVAFSNGDRSTLGPYYGYLNGHFLPYDEDCDDLKVIVHPRQIGLRPYLEIKPCDHALSCEQRNGISAERLAEIYEIMMHRKN